LNIGTPNSGSKCLGKIHRLKANTIPKKNTDNISIMKNLKHLITITTLLMITINSYSQVGIGTTTPLGALDVTSTNDGLVIPRVALTATNNQSPLVIAPVESELVYNTVTAGIAPNNVTPGYYYWGGATWVRLASGSVVETDPQVTCATTSRVPRWNNFVGTLQDGLITDNGTRVGINVAVPAGALEIFAGASPDGLVIPRVALLATNNQSPLVIAPVESELVYNTVTAGIAPNNVTPGYYYWNGSSWLRIATTNDITASNNAWSITGNTGTTAANFIGTTDNIDVAFRRNNAAAGKIQANNTFFGVGAGKDNTSTANVFLGSGAGLNSSNAASSNIVAIGHQAMGGVGTSNVAQSVAIGAFAMEAPTATANGNVVIGNLAATNLGTANNVIIGQGAGNSGVTGNCIVIGQGAVSGGFSSIRIGTNQTLAQVPVAWNIISDRRAKSDIKDSALGVDFIKTLRPVSYFKNNDEKKRTEYGFIAQEVEEALINVGDKNNGVVHIDPNGDYSLRYNDFISISVKAIQEQQELIEALQKSNAELLKANAAILERLERLEKK
jgi:hypothetical protein